MHLDKTSIQAEGRSLSGGTKRKHGDGTRSSTRPFSDMSEVSNGILETCSSKKRGSKRPVFSEAQLTTEGTQANEPPTKRREAISDVPGYQPCPTQPPKPDDLGYQKARCPRKDQRQQVKIPITGGEQSNTIYTLSSNS